MAEQDVAVAEAEEEEAFVAPERGSADELLDAGAHSKLDAMRHSAAHVMAEAVTRLFPGAKYTIGPAIADGFYYDFDLPDDRTFTSDDLGKIEDEMRAIVNAVAAQATIVLPGLGEGELLTGQSDPAAIAEFYLRAGVDQVVLKLGADGAQAWDGTHTVASRPIRVVPVDTVGAGDGFAAGYLDAFLAGRDLQECVDQAAAVGALVTTRRGDLAAMPTRSELDAFIAPT